MLTFSYKGKMIKYISSLVNSYCRSIYIKKLRIKRLKRITLNNSKVLKILFFAIFLLTTAFRFTSILIMDQAYKSHGKRVFMEEPKAEIEAEELLNIQFRAFESLEFPIHNQEDATLVKNLFSTMTPPSLEELTYSYRTSYFEPSRGKDKIVRKLTNYKEKGFFVEVGAKNGEILSNTLFLEEHLGWTGLLIEQDPEFSARLREVKRRAWSSQTCISHNTSAYQSHIRRRRISFWEPLLLEPSLVPVVCYPFYTFLLALDVTEVDYLSLDVGGTEIEVLETIPFDKVDITVISVEFSKSRGGLLGVVEVMERNGYKMVQEVYPDDVVFVKSTQRDSRF